MTIQRVSSLVSNYWLKRSIGKLNVNDVGASFRIVDCTFGADDGGALKYEKQHIPTAVHFDILKCVQPSKYIPRNLPSISCFDNYVGSLGVNNNTHVIAYDQNDSRFSCRAWWLFKAYGHDKVSVLDGGMKKWLLDECEITDEFTDVKEEKFTSRIDQSWIRTYSDVIVAMETGDAQIVDARNETEFSGVEDPPSMELHRGHISGSFNIPWRSLLNDDGTFKSEHEIEQLFRAVQLDPDKPMIASCLLGITAAGLALSADRLGKCMPMYYGSWYEFRQRAEADLVEQGNN